MRSLLSTAVGTALLVTACAGATPTGSNSPSASDFPGPRPTAPVPWTSLTPTPLVTKPFSGVGNQYVMDVTAYRDGFVAVGEDFRSDSDVVAAIWVTPNGTTWHRVSASDSDLAAAVLDHVATDGTKLVAFGHVRTGPGGDPNSRIVWVSDDADRWHRLAPDRAMAATDGIAGVTGGPAGFIAWSSASRNAVVFHSADGTSWQRSASPASFAGAEIRGIQPYRGGFVAVGAHLPPPPPSGQLSAGGPDKSAAMAWWSPDGLTWTTADVDAGPGLQGVEVAPDGLLGLGNSGCGGCVSPGQLWHSTDGRTWKRIGTDLEHWPAYSADGTRIARFDWQDSGDVAWSVDGTSWTRIGHLKHPDLYGFTLGSHGLLVKESIVSTRTPEDVDGAMWFIAANT